MKNSISGTPEQPIFTVAMLIDTGTVGPLERAGIIPFAKTKAGKIQFLTGKHTPSGQLCDGGGGIKRGETPLEAAIREFDEESLGMFKDSNWALNVRQIKYSPALVYGKCAIVFVHVPEAWIELAEKEFDRLSSIFPLDEWKGVKWVSEHNLEKLIKKEKKGLWKRLRQVLGSLDFQVLKEGIRLVAGSKNWPEVDQRDQLIR
jgi:hypothetical protein